MAHFKIAEFPHHLHLDFFSAKAGNALGLEVARELSAIQKKYKKWNKPVVVSSAHPTLFCSGGNLSDYKKLKGKERGLIVNHEIARHLDAFGSWAVVKLALVEGDALGGGMEWLARFDYRWTTPHALFSFWQRRIGLSPGWGGGSAWASLIGEDRLRALLLEAEMISAGTALRLGMVDRILCNWKIRESVVDWALRMDDPSVRALFKWSAGKESSAFQKLWMGPEHRAALARWNP
ncbi:MAG: enoyl-CoA hydratase/isomerase family protein [Bdellovibrionales bacterium]